MKDFYILILCLVGVTAASNVTTETTTTCPFLPNCNCNETTLICDNFTYFDELDFTSQPKNLTNAYTFTNIIISPLKDQPLGEDDLNLSGLSIDTTHNVTVEISNVNTFYFNANPLAKLNNIYRHHTITLKLVNSRFKFKYSESVDLNSLCELESFAANRHKLHESMFTMASRLHLHGVKFVEPVCPFIFMNVRLVQVHISSPIMANGAMDAFEFLAVKLDVKNPIRPPWDNFILDDETSELNSVVYSLTVENTRFDQLDETNIPKLIFYNMRFLQLNNVEINAIDDGLFYNFKYLKKLYLNLNNWDEFLDKYDSMEFLDGLNSNVKPVNLDLNITKQVDLKQTLHVYMDGRGLVEELNYQFPDRDFCQFVDFPLYRLVEPYVFTPEMRCSCTIKWLSRYVNKFLFDEYFLTSTGAMCASSPSLKCDFNELKSKCKNLKPEIVDFVNDEKKNTKTQLTKGTIALIVIACVMVVLVIFVIMLKNHFKSKRIKSLDIPIPTLQMTTSPMESSNNNYINFDNNQSQVWNLTMEGLNNNNPTSTTTTNNNNNSQRQVFKF